MKVIAVLVLAAMLAGAVERDASAACRINPNRPQCRGEQLVV